jgi:prevent-host-death family protein
MPFIEMKTITVKTKTKTDAKTRTMDTKTSVVRERASSTLLASAAVSVAEAKKELSELCSRVGYGRDTVVVTKRGKPLVAIVSVADLERYLALEDEHAARILEIALATSRGLERVTPP